MRTPARWFSVGAGVLALVGTIPAGAADTTSVTVASATAAGASIQVAGTLTLGADALAPVTLVDDPQGDSTVSGAGLDFGKVTVTTDLAGSKLTYTINTFDMPPVVNQTAPFYGYISPIMVDGNDAPRYFLAAGNIGANFPPAIGRFWALCTNAAGYACGTVLTGTMGSNVITLNLPFAKAAIKRGSTVEVGAGLACPGLCSTIWAVLLFNNTGGDSGAFIGFKVPGEVRLGIGPADTPVGNIATDTPATVKADGTWTGSIGAPGAPGEYQVVARSCWGSTEEPVCATGTAAVTI